MVLRKKYISGYKRWLELHNYVQASIEYGPERLKDFLGWMEGKDLNEIEAFTGSDVKQYFEELSRRKSQRTGEVISDATQRSYLTTINRFARYLRQTEQGNIDVPVSIKGERKKPIVLLSKEEIVSLYEHCDDSLLGVRDRALLSVFYGCGVRRNEAVHLEVKDVLGERNLLYVRKGKGYKERYVPMVGAVRKDIVDYMVRVRPMLRGREVHEVLFVGMQGKPLSGSSMYERIKKLVKKSGVEKQVGLHTLRHSIATHLLANGMKLCEIGQFLGHSSLESTQIYTHIKDDGL